MNRDVHLAEFDRLTGLLAINSRAAVTVMRRASVALLAVDRRMAEVVATDSVAIKALHREISELIPVLLARQEPIASDLRLVLAAVHANNDMARMAALAGHVAKIGLSRYPALAVPSDALATLSSMADAAIEIAAKSSTVLATRDALDAMQLGLDDDITDSLARKLHAQIRGDWRHGIAAAIDLAMLGRFYERYADYAVNVARQVVYIVTGEVRR